MAVTKDQVLATAKLARIDLSYGKTESDAEMSIAKLASQMEEIVDYITILESLDTTDVEPMYSPLHVMATPRHDVSVIRNNADAILSNAPDKQDTFFVVPPVLS